MPKPTFKSVDDYISQQPEAAQAVLKRVRRAIRNALPASLEVISYGIPAYQLNGVRVIYFAGWKKHFSLYPAKARLVREFKDELSPYDSSKGTIRFPLSGRLPLKLIARIARFRAKEVAKEAAQEAPKEAAREWPESPHRIRCSDDPIFRYLVNTGYRRLGEMVATSRHFVVNRQNLPFSL
jgi:uncharacterized protein YdhG (YjbR/CyaY superfamily)